MSFTIQWNSDLTKVSAIHLLQCSATGDRLGQESVTLFIHLALVVTVPLKTCALLVLILATASADVED